MTRKTPKRAAPTPDTGKSGERIAKIMARAGLCSRREAEAWIAAGRVSVNGATISSPALNVGPKDRIAIDGRPMRARERTRLFLYHKSRGLVTTNADPEGRATIYGALPRHLPRVISVGRLDLNTEGLLLLTNDGGLARVLELPTTGWLRRYRVRAHGEIAQETLNRLRNGITIDGVRYGAIEALLDRVQGANVWLTFAMREGKNREVRNVLEHLGLKVNRLIRVSYGPFQLGDLPDGATEEVPTRVLREQLGDSIVRAAGVDFSAPLYEPEAPAQHRLLADSERLPPVGGKKAVATRTAAEAPAAKRGRGSDRSAPPRRPVSDKDEAREDRATSVGVVGQKPLGSKERRFAARAERRRHGADGPLQLEEARKLKRGANTDASHDSADSPRTEARSRTSGPRSRHHRSGGPRPSTPKTDDRTSGERKIGDRKSGEHRSEARQSGVPGKGGGKPGALKKSGPPSGLSRFAGPRPARSKRGGPVRGGHKR